MLSALAAACESNGPSTGAGNLVGNAACLACHENKAGYLATAHHRTSLLASASTIHGVFTAGENILPTSNPNLHYRMDSTATGFHQTAITGTPPDTSSRSERIDIVVGSGRKGQTYLSWRDGDRLFQLPVSYWTELKGWVNSPGYRDGEMSFDRQVAPRCLECHATQFESIPGLGVENRYDRTNFTLGISCERCHGPGREHIKRQHSAVQRFFDRAIINPARLPRERQIDLCAQCHGGLGEPLAPSFTYVPGQPLDRYLRLEEPAPGAEIDVHGNQVALLARSPCFQESAMTCSTCHDPHTVQRDPAAFSAKCLSCHQVRQCGLFPERGHAIAGNCTRCHMPELRSNTIVSSLVAGKIQPRVRTHWIKVYPLGDTL